MWYSGCGLHTRQREAIIVAALEVTTPLTMAAPKPLPPLTSANCAEVVQQLRAYLAEVYAQFRYAWPMPSFRMVWRSFPLEQMPPSNLVPRRSEGTHSDPTAFEGIARAEGVSIQVPETLLVPAAAFDAYLEAMPAHLRTVLTTIVIPIRSHRGIWDTPGTVYSLQVKLGVSQATVYRRLDDALAWLAAQLYGERWPTHASVDSD